MPNYTSVSRLLISADGTIIYADATGDPALPAFIFTHGHSLSSIVWDNVFSDPKWYSSAYLVRYDARGHGRSDKPDRVEDYTSEKEAQDFQTVVNAFRLHKPFFVGWDIGACLLTDIYTFLSPTLLCGAVYVSAIPWLELYEAVATPALQASIDALTARDDVVAANRAVYYFMNNVVFDTTVMPYRLRGQWVAEVVAQSPVVRQRTLNRAQNPKALIDRAGPSLPVLAIHGTHDAHIVGNSVVETIQIVFRMLQVHFIKGVGHTPFLEAPDEFRRTVLAFAQRVISEG